MEDSKAVRVYLLCSPYIEHGANTRTLKYQKSRILLAWLTLHPGQRYTRDWLAEWLWPEEEATAGRRKLKRSLFELREIFAEALESGRDHVCLHAAGTLWVDALAFTERLASDRGAAQTDSLGLLEWLEATAELYRGSFLEGIQTTTDEACDRWVQDCRERYRQAALQLYQRLADGFAAHGDQQRALSYSRRLTREEPWNERAWQQLIGLLVGYGHHGEAQNVLAQCRSALASELDAEPCAETLALLNATPLAPAPEQRGMTVLCCRLQGPDSGEPDDLLALQEPIDRCLQLLNEAGARVYRSASDDLLAFFGYPRAMENAALRAVGAALDCLATVAAPLSAVCALHSGLALSLPDSDVPDAGGRLSRLALRLADSALPDQLLASQATVEQLPREPFEMTPLAPLRLPGSAQRLPVWLIGAQRGQRVPSRNEAPVGRDDILQALQALWQRARDGGGLSVLVSGEAGIGKSTVLQFFTRQHALPGVELVCRLESAGTPLHPFLHWLQRLPTPEDAAGREALASLHELLETTRRTPALAPDICTRLLSLLCSQVPPGGVICIDDAHWADPSTRELLGRLIQQPLPGRLLLIASRETLNPSWEVPGKAEHLHLPALSEDASSTLVGRLSGPEGLPATTIRQVARACAGVPLFIEEMTRNLIASDRAAQAPLTLPLSLQDLLMAHIDSLAQAKPLAQLAAAFDSDFSPALLAEAAELEPRQLEPLLHTLRQQRLLVPGTERELAFRHVLLREAAYQSMPRSRRQWAHGRILASLLRLQPTLASEEPDRLAWHSERAGQVPAARGYLLAAGRLAVLRSAYHEALEHYRHALALLDEGADALEELQLRMAMGTPLAILHGNGAQSCRDNFDRALQLAEPLGDDARLFPVYWGLWLGSSSWRGFLQSELIARRLIRLAQQASDSELLGQGYYALGNSLFTMGRFHEARACLERASELPLPPPGTALHLGEDARANSLSFLALALWFCGREPEAREASAQALQRAHRLDSAYVHCQTLSLAALFGQAAEDADYTEQCAREGLEIARKHDIALWKMACATLLGWAQARRGQADAIVSMLESSAAVGQVMGGSDIFFQAIIADAAWHAGLRDSGLAAVERGLATARQYAGHYPVAELLRIKGEWLCRDGETRASGIACLEQALDTASQQDSPPLILRAAHSLLGQRPNDPALAGLLAETRARLHPGEPVG
ncbi:MAG TPA: AAA family ATPase [Pseudomonas sp.]|nr:AAA family ATPase [Pseudomonas sp.]